MGGKPEIWGIEDCDNIQGAVLASQDDFSDHLLECAVQEIKR